MSTKRISASVLILILLFGIETTQAQDQRGRRNRNQNQDWNSIEYSGNRSPRQLRTALASKGFTWLSGSPADNEKLSIGKNSQFFGFVALRYQSGRAANRGALGRAFFSLANTNQRMILSRTVLAEEKLLRQWWETRNQLLRLFENHLYTGIPIDEGKAAQVGDKYAELSAMVSIIEARAFATLEDSLTVAQRSQIQSWRENPERAQQVRRDNRMVVTGFNRDQTKQLENLFAKAISWITGTEKDNEVIPLGQPAQFFGFVSIRHKSGHAANRGSIAKSFLEILDSDQHAVIDKAIRSQGPTVQRFLANRRRFLDALGLLRSQPNRFKQAEAIEIAVEMGKNEIEVGSIEAEAYRQIREMMTDDQTSQMMQLRGNYVLDQSEVETKTFAERGAQLAILCASCHGGPGQHRSTMLGPSLDGIFSRPIASSSGYEYSEAFSKFRSGRNWTSETMDQFLTRPRAYVPGTKMQFQGLLKPEDRKALIHYL